MWYFVFLRLIQAVLFFELGLLFIKVLGNQKRQNLLCGVFVLMAKFVGTALLLLAFLELSFFILELLAPII